MSDQTEHQPATASIPDGPSWEVCRTCLAKWPCPWSEEGQERIKATMDTLIRFERYLDDIRLDG